MVDVYTSLKILYFLFGISLTLNVILAFKVRSLRLKIEEMNSRITLSEEEIQQITARLKRLSELHGDIELPPITLRR
jgi:hypothetical protein